MAGLRCYMPKTFSPICWPEFWHARTLSNRGVAVHRHHPARTDNLCKGIRTPGTQLKSQLMSLVRWFSWPTTMVCETLARLSIPCWFFGHPVPMASYKAVIATKEHTPPPCPPLTGSVAHQSYQLWLRSRHLA